MTKFEMIKCATAVACPQEQVSFSHKEYDIEEHGPAGFKIKIASRTKTYPVGHPNEGQPVTVYTTYFNVPYWRELPAAPAPAYIEDAHSEPSDARQPGRPGRKPKAV